MNQKYFFPVKIVAAIFTTLGLFLELWNIYHIVYHTQIYPTVTKLIWLAHFVITAHFLEAVIAAFLISSKTPSEDRKPFRYGIYTFFVGTVGLLELNNNDSEQASVK